MKEAYADLLRRLDAVPAGPGFWKARCPVHQGRPRNLRLWIGRRGNLMVGCWRCHGQGGGPAKSSWLATFCQATGITMRELFEDGDGPAQPYRERSRPKLVATYTYTDENGLPLHRKHRYEPKSFSQERYDAQESRWHPGLGNWPQYRRVLYRLPELLSDPANGILVVEGESKVDLLSVWGFVATCACEGSSQWLDEYSLVLAGRDVVLLPDNDAPGYRFMDQVAGSLLRNGAHSLRIVLLPGLPKAGDIKNFRDSGGTADDLRRVVLSTRLWH